MTTTIERTKKIDYKEFVRQVESNKFKVDEVDYKELIDRKDYAEVMYLNTKKDADRYNVPAVRTLFNELCAEHYEIIDINTYIAEYMELVNEAIDEDYYIQQLTDEKEIQVYRDIMKLRGYSAYKSNLAEISLKLLCEDIYEDEYIVVSNEKTDGILGVDIVLLHEEDDIAHYIHVTKDTKFAMDKLERKSGKEVTVIDSRLDNKFGWADEQQRNHIRKFKNHVLALYSDENNYMNRTINSVYLFNEEYVRELIEDNVGLCTKAQYDELQYLEYSSKQIRRRGNSWITLAE